jgi:hypothetical protein
VCLCGPKSCFFSPLSLPFFCVLTSSSTSSSTSADLIQKNKKKKRDRSLLSLSLFPTKKRFLQLVRDAFSLPSANFSSLIELSKAKKAEKIQNLRAERFHQTRALAHAGRERGKKTTDFERIELFSSSRCVLSLFFAFARRRGRNFARKD